MSMHKLMKQAQEMQDRYQQELAEVVVESRAGGGMVTVKLNGKKDVVGIKIDPEAIDPEDPSILEDLVLAAVNDAHRILEETMQEKLGAIAASMPRLFGPDS